MGLALLLDFAYAAGVAISPTPVMVVLLMLFSPGGRKSAFAFLIGWVVGLGLLAFVVYWILETGRSALESSSAFSRPAIQIMLGIAVIWIGARQWKKPPRQNAENATPKWMASADRVLSQSSDKFTPRRALFLAVFMSALSPKNIALMLAFGLSLTQASLRTDQSAALLFLFVVLSSLTIGIPVLYAMVKGEGAQDDLNRVKSWVVSNRSRSLALLLFVLAGIMIINALVQVLQKTTFGH
jgi:threonine/homoserine/homoserine lactone efflux protein